MAMTLSRKPLPSAAVDESARSPLDFDALFEQHWTPLCRMLYGILGDWDEAEDSALEAFLKLSRTPPADHSQPSGWLYRVASNLGLNALRARARRKRYEALVPEPQNSEDPAVAAERRLEQIRVRETLAGIKPAAAQILLLRYSGLSYAEIAAAMEISPSSVGAQLARAEKAFEARFRSAEG